MNAQARFRADLAEAARRRRRWEAARTSSLYVGAGRPGREPSARPAPISVHVARALFGGFVVFGLFVLGILICEALAYTGPVFGTVGLLLAAAACCAWVAIGKAWA